MTWTNSINDGFFGKRLLNRRLRVYSNFANWRLVGQDSTEPSEGSGSSSPILEISFNGARFCFVGRLATTISSASRLEAEGAKTKTCERWKNKKATINYFNSPGFWCCDEGGEKDSIRSSNSLVTALSKEANRAAVSADGGCSMVEWKKMKTFLWVLVLNSIRQFLFVLDPEHFLENLVANSFVYFNILRFY